MTIWKDFTFEASHRLPLHEGKCRFLHGHSWKLRVLVEGSVSVETGFVVDYAKLKQLVEEHVIKILDHQHLGFGDMSSPPSSFIAKAALGLDFYPTSENIAKAIYHILKPLIRELGQDVRLYEVQIQETCTSGASYGREDDPNRD